MARVEGSAATSLAFFSSLVAVFAPGTMSSSVLNLIHEAGSFATIGGNLASRNFDDVFDLADGSPLGCDAKIFATLSAYSLTLSNSCSVRSEEHTSELQSRFD